MATNNTPNCHKCVYMLQGNREKETGNNRHKGGPRAPCFCDHPDAVETFHRVCPKGHKYAGFIAYTPCGKDGPKIKTSPVWCPRRPANQKEAQP